MTEQPWVVAGREAWCAVLKHTEISDRETREDVLLGVHDDEDDVRLAIEAARLGYIAALRRARRKVPHAITALISEAEGGK